MDESNLPFVLTGGPGTGKSTVLGLLANQGCFCISESARGIIRQRTNQGLPKRPEPILEADILAYEKIPKCDYPIFIDRGIADVLNMLFEIGKVDLAEAKRRLSIYPIQRQVFFFKP